MTRWITSVVIWCVDNCVAGEIERWSLRDSEGIWVEGQEAKVFFFKYVAEPVHVESMLIKRHKMTFYGQT